MPKINISGSLAPLLDYGYSSSGV